MAEAEKTHNKSLTRPKTIAELLPCLTGILSKDAVNALTAKKQPKIPFQTRTNEKVVRPLTIAQMRADILPLKIQSPRRAAQGSPHKKKHWNSSVKVEKRICHTSDGQLRNNPVRKVLNFQQKTKPSQASRATMHTEFPKFPKPEAFPRKPLQYHGKKPRISGIYDIPETPILSNYTSKSRLTLANKENISSICFDKRKTIKPTFHKKNIPSVSDTPLSNESWKSSCDASFLQKEKEIRESEEKTNAITEEKTLDKISEVTPPASTPFKDYRNVTDFFDSTDGLESSIAFIDNTIMCFDKPTSTCSKEKATREESVIVSLCDLFSKTNFNYDKKINTEIHELLQVEVQTEQNIRMIDNGIEILNKIKQTHLKSLEYIRKLIYEKNISNKSTKAEEQVPPVVKEETKAEETNKEQSKQCSVIQSCQKSPSYKIPKRNSCLRKKVFHKSMPNVTVQTPQLDNQALNMYMKMKEQMHFLNTPSVKQRTGGLPDTPALTSRNLQKQLDKLFAES